ncbi:MAG: hypothetical protein CMI60_01140 [Parvibaculum sp.]|nr:hypothetical protein [Parvibaculum sp.]
MPIVFNPGEAETRPLDPSAIVYTTAQKVADFLSIGPQEAVLVSADSTTTAVFVTGADYRTVGFQKDDTILIYSDADPLGTERVITSIGSSASGVQLNFADVITAADYQAADNAYVQNTASFTNGKTRGMKRSVVEARIKEAQDKIDNLTHNAWRPYLVSAEYINFDTYKPYRRRYYTDYVGTAPLLFRNIQQILRLELWQGDDYREICSAEARIKLPEDVRGLSGSIVVSPGNGTAATLTIGTATTQWRADFDAATTGQNLADLINKEDRVNKAAVDFAPAFTLEGSTANVALNNEFLATANADYGTGQVKMTSMRAGKGGESCSIVSTDSNIEFAQVDTHTATVTSVVSTTVNVNSTSGFSSAGVCVKGDTVFRYTGKTATSFTGCVIVVGSPLSDILGDIIQNTMVIDLQGGSNKGDNARLRDWWLDHEMGVIYFNNSYPFFEWNAIKCSYIYGERYLEKAIEEAATKMVACDVLMSDDRSVLIPEGTQNVDLTSKIQLLKSEVDAILARYIEIIVFE